MNILQKNAKTLILAATCFLLPSIAQAQDVIGRVIQTTGVVSGVDTAGEARRLARGSNVLVSETITTGPRGSAQLRLSDGAVITLNEDSFFTVDDFEYDGAGGADDTVVMTMARGTMRTITGVIGDAPGDTYSMNTPFASIGVRGTEYAVVVEASGRVRVFVFDGSISVAPGAGGVPTIVGLEGDSDAVDVQDDTAVTEITGDDIPAAIQAVVDSMEAAPISEAEVAALPAADVAVQIQRNTEQQQQQEQQEEQAETLPGGRDSAGALVDAQGRVQTASTETEVIQARTVVVISVSEEDPDAFDVTTIVGASPN